MKKLLVVVVAAAGAGYALWQYWQQTNEATAKAWAQGTDKVE